MVTWASGLCLHRAKWSEDKGSQWPRERKGRRMINPDIRVRRGEQASSLAFQCLPLRPDRRSLPDPPLASGRMLRCPLLLGHLDAAGSVTASSCSVQVPLWGHCPRGLRCQSRSTELWEGVQLQEGEGQPGTACGRLFSPSPRAGEGRWAVAAGAGGAYPSDTHRT